MSNFLAGCGNSNVCGSPLTPVKTSASQSPFVKLTITDNAGGDQVITVGNESVPKYGNNAIIKSFELGISDGFTGMVEIVDEHGGAFETFVNRLAKDMNTMSKSYSAILTFGWVTTECDGTFSFKSSPEVYASPQNIEVMYGEGKIKYRVAFLDLLQQSVFVTREDTPVGADSHRVLLTEAVKTMMSRAEPKIEVEFIRQPPNKNTQPTPIEKLEGDPKATWPAHGQDKLTQIINWLRNFKTDQGKPLIPMWDTCNKTPKLLLVEDPQDEQHPGFRQGVGEPLATFIVNGGNCSNVLSFTPQLNWIQPLSALNIGGNSGGAGSGAGIKFDDSKSDKNSVGRNPPIQTNNTGMLKSSPTTAQSWNVYGPDQAGKEQAECNNLWDQTSRIMSANNMMPINAELSFIGDAENFTHFLDVFFKPVSVIVINPFSIVGGTPNTCGDWHWLADSPCNTMMTNKNWMIQGMHHAIREGSFVTTLNLTLFTFDTDSASQLGGTGGPIVQTN